jgi:rhamnose transport system permease protein
VTALETTARWPTSTLGWRRRVKGVAIGREAYLIVILIVLSLLISLVEPRFLNTDNLQQVLLSATLVSIVAIGEAMIIIARQIDISVGPIVAASAFVSADFLAQHPSEPLILIFAIGCGIGAAMGAINGVLVAGFRIPAIVATLGTLAMFRGAIIVLAGGRQISATVLPKNFAQLAEASFLGLPALVWAAAVLVLVFSWTARFTRFGRNLYAIGSNPEGARLAGINEGLHIGLAFVQMGLLCGLVGVLWAARFGTVHAAIAPTLNIDVILACVLGGVSIFGGSGTIVGAVVGALIIAVLKNGVLLVGVNQFWIQAIIGAAILATVVFYNLATLRAERKLMAARRSTRAMTRLRKGPGQ